MAKKSKKQEVKYEDMVKTYQDNLETFGHFYYASLMKSGEYGKEGLVDGLNATLVGLKDKIGLEGILNGLETQAMQSIEEGNGVNAQLNLAEIIKNNAQAYIESAVLLKINDLTPYIKERLGKDVEIVSEGKYQNKRLGELLDKKASKEEQNYGIYLLSQLRNSVMAEMTPLSYQERARKTTEAYKRAGLSQERARKTTEAYKRAGLSPYKK